MAKLYLVLRIGPLGLDHTELLLTDERREPYSVTRGEGQALLFELIDGDYSTEFAKAMKDGLVLNHVGRRWHKVDIRRREE